MGIRTLDVYMPMRVPLRPPGGYPVVVCGVRTLARLPQSSRRVLVMGAEMHVVSVPQRTAVPTMKKQE